MGPRDDAAKMPQYHKWHHAAYRTVRSATEWDFKMWRNRYSAKTQRDKTRYGNTDSSSTVIMCNRGERESQQRRLFDAHYRPSATPHKPNLNTVEPQIREVLGKQRLMTCSSLCSFDFFICLYFCLRSSCKSVLFANVTDLVLHFLNGRVFLSKLHG